MKQLKTLNDYLAQQTDNIDNRPLSIKQKYLAISNGISKNDRNKLTHAEIVQHQHLFLSTENKLTPLQRKFLKETLEIDPDSEGVNFKSARSIIIKHLQKTDFDQEIQAYLDELTANYKKNKEENVSVTESIQSVIEKYR